VITIAINDAPLRKQIRTLGGPRLRMVARRVVTENARPILRAAKALVPVDGGRIRASLGQLVASNRRKDAFTGRIGTRRDFTYRRKTDGAKLVSGRGKVRDRAMARGFRQDKGSPNLYAGGIEFGTDKSGRVVRKAGGATFLNRAILGEKQRIETTIADAFRRHINQVQP
jgi:hypothetical protein